MSADPIPPGHGEPESSSFGRGSNTYSDEEWESLDFGAWPTEVSQCNTARKENTRVSHRA